MTDKRDDHSLDEALDSFFAAGRDTAPVPSADLVAAILADAAAEQASAGAPAPDMPRRPGLWAGLLTSVGGWPGALGLTAAACAGILIGVAAPTLVDTLSGGVVGTANAAEGLYPSYTLLLGE